MFSPDRQGFFPALWVQFSQELGQGERRDFTALTSRDERVKWMYQHRFPRARFELLRSMRQEKDPELSRTRREAGNQAFQSGELNVAMVNYSRAVVLAKDKSPELSSALANRAACLQRLGCPKFALTDIALALENNYPEQNMFKLLERKAQCFIQLREFPEALDTLKAAVSAMAKANMDKKKRERFLKDIEQSKVKIKEEEAKEDEIDGVEVVKTSWEQQRESILSVATPGRRFPAANSAVSVRYQKGRGRFVVAAKDIPVGTTLVVEQPVTWALHPDRYGSHCQNCLSQVKAVLPCTSCCGVSFCSLDCRQEALDTYHRVECGLNDVMTASGLNIYPSLTVRLMTRFGLEHIWGLREKMESHDDRTGALEEEEEYRSDDFLNAFNLVCHEDKMDDEEHLLRTFVAVFLLKLLQFNGFFGKPREEENLMRDAELSEKELFIGTVILHFTNTFPQNVHDIALLQTHDTSRWLNSAEIKSLGAGVFLTSALFNHSCDPSFMRCNFGKGMVSVANRHIKAGEEISECYGQMYYSKGRDQRREELSRHYKFECSCLACLEDWPTIRDLQYATGGKETKHRDLLRVRCCGCGQQLDRKKGLKVASRLTCLVCGQETEVESVPLAAIREASVRAESLLCDKLDWARGLQAVRICQDLFDQHLVAPSIDLYTSQISIWRALWLVVGNKKLVKGIL